MNPSDAHHHHATPGADALALLHSVTHYLGSAVALVDGTGQWIFLSDAMRAKLAEGHGRLMKELTDRAVICIRQQSEDIFTPNLRHTNAEDIEQIHYHPLDALPNGLCLLTASTSVAPEDTTGTSHALLDSLKRQALTDPLTGLFNRRYLNREAPVLLQKAIATQKPLSLVLLDLDHFKQINDVHGHLTGDHVLRIAGSRMRSAVRPQDRVCRYGGEEFLVLLPETDIELATSITERIRTRLADPLDGLADLRLSASAGVSTFDVQERPPETAFAAALARADMALYEAKAAGRDCVRTEHRSPPVKSKP